MLKKFICLVSVFVFVLGTIAYADNYKMVSEKKDADGNREVTYDNGKVSTFNYDETYIVSEKDEGDFTIDTYNDGSITKIYTWQLKEMERLKKDKKFLSIGFNTKKNNDGTKTVTRIRYSETKEWIDVPNGELVLQQNDSTPYQCHLYLAKKFFPNDDIYTKRMEYNENAQVEKERLQAQYAEAHEKAEEKRQEQQAKQEARINKGDIASIKKDAINYSEICAKEIAGDNHILNDINDIQSYIASYAPYVETAYKNGNKWYRSDVQYSSDVTIAKNLTDEDLKNIITKHNGKSTPNDKDTKKLSIAGFIVFDKWIMTPSEYEEYLNKTYDYMIGAIDSINLDEKASVSNKKSAIKSIKTEFAKKKPNGNTSEIDDVKKAIDLRDSLKNKMDEYVKAIIK